MSTPAVVWSDRAEAARRQQQAELRFADAIVHSPIPAGDQAADRLRQARFALQLEHAAAWGEYAEHCEQVAADERRHELAVPA